MLALLLNSLPEIYPLGYLLNSIYVITVIAFIAKLYYLKVQPSVNPQIFEKTSETFQNNPTKTVPISVNFHFTRKCNYECGFCFHTAKTSYLTPLENAKLGLKKLADLGMKKLNLSGGEPFMHPKYLGEICKFCKEVLNLQSVSIVSNGSLIKKKFFKEYGAFVDILAISVDSFDEDTNVKIGRGKGKHLNQLHDISEWCTEFEVKFKLNSVINKYNHKEDFSSTIKSLNPARWKCFQVLKVDTENSGEAAKRDCSDFLISDDDFEAFCKRHSDLPCFVPESNLMMKSSYLILDEYMRFLNKGDVYKESQSILDVDVEQALEETDWQPDVFVQRGGIYDWTRISATGGGGGCSKTPSQLEWPYSVISTLADELVNLICLTGLIMSISVTLLWGASFVILLNWMKNMNASSEKKHSSKSLQENTKSQSANSEEIGSVVKRALTGSTS